MTRHVQVHVQVGSVEASVDVKIAPLVRALWRAGIGTLASCQRFEHTGYVWIAFSSRDAAQQFSRITGIGVENFTLTAEDKAAANDHSADGLPVGAVIWQTLFAPEHLTAVLAKVRRHNKRGLKRKPQQDGGTP